jgi:hypothetical protein
MKQMKAEQWNVKRENKLDANYQCHEKDSWCIFVQEGTKKGYIQLGTRGSNVKAFLPPATGKLFKGQGIPDYVLKKANELTGTVITDKLLRPLTDERIRKFEEHAEIQVKNVGFYKLLVSSKQTQMQTVKGEDSSDNVFIKWKKEDGELEEIFAFRSLQERHSLVNEIIEEAEEANYDKEKFLKNLEVRKEEYEKAIG